MKLLQELFANGLISDKRLDELQKQVLGQSKTEEDLILENRIISEDSLFELKSKILKVPLKKVKPEQIAPEVLELVPEEASQNYKMAAISKNEKAVQIGMVYPENIAAQNALRFLASQQKFNYQVYLITKSDFENLLKQRKDISVEAKKALFELDREKGEIMEALGKEAYAGAITEDAPVVKMVQALLRHAVEGKASDIHIEPAREKLVVRFRQNGILHTSISLPLKVHLSVAARIKILAGLKIDENRVPQDGRFSSKVNDLDVDFRVSTFPTLYGEKVEIRVLDPSAGLKSFEDLGLSGRNLEAVKSAIKKPYGMILLTGPTGSGKTTTQYAILRVLNQESVNIVTVEDPIEYSIEGINQSQVKPEIGYTFARGLRQILRQDPNIIMVGEIRDEETADLAVNAALTGHIVLSTLHTNSSVGVVPRLVDMGIRPFLIPSVLRLVISQRLVRTLCSSCKIKIRPAERIRSYITQKVKTLPLSVRNEAKIPEPFYIYGAKGCQSCNFTGYSGRAGLYEVLTMSDELAGLVLKNALESQVFKAAQKQGMVSMEQAGILKVLEGKTTIEEVARVSGEKD